MAFSNARAKTYELQARLARAGINADFDVAHTLRRAELTLHRWAELECGDGRGCIERDEFSGIPQWRWATDTGKLCGRPIPDREKGALRRVKATGLYFYHQTDPRGAALYVANVPLNNQNYSSIGVCCAV